MCRPNAGSSRQSSGATTQARASRVSTSVVLRALVLVILVCAGCGAGSLVAGPAGDVAPERLDSTPPRHVSGERMTWEVFWQGVAIGRAELVADPGGVRCTFRTGALASALASVRYDASTVIAHGEIGALAETLEIDRAPEERHARIDGPAFVLDDGVRHHVPGGTRLHTLGSALLVLRAWSAESAGPGYVWLLHRGALYRLDVRRPVRDEALGRAALRIDGEVRSLAQDSLGISVWLAANRDRTPLRITVETDAHRVSAELIAANTSITAD